MKIRLPLLLFSAFLYGCQSPPKNLESAVKSHEEICDTQSIMATAWKICLIDESKSAEELKTAIDTGMTEIRRIDSWMSEWREDTLISKVNREAWQMPVVLSDEAFDIFKASQEHAHLTEGAFDITFNVFFGLYGWKPGHEHFPSKKEIQERLPFVNYKNLVLDEAKKTVFFKKKGMRIGFGGIGQGWTVDRVVKILRDEKKIAAGFVDGSGDSYFWGKKPGGLLWTVGIANPRSHDRQVLFKMYLTDKAVTTSGDTEKFFIKNGVRYHHIIDPHTGDSVRLSAQVTAICESATLCDAADGGIFVLGPQKGIAYAHKIGIRAVVIDPTLTVHLSKGLRPMKTQWGNALEMY